MTQTKPIQQRTADGALLGMAGWALVPPTSDDFSTYGTADTVRRARQWALDHQFLLYRGTAAHCVHGLYRMDTCAARVACNSAGMDHTQIWVQHDARGAFILTQPYATKIPDSLRTYAEMHGLSIDSWPFDGWYGGGTLPIRMTIPDDWPLWPIERDAVVLLHTQPIAWPEETD